MRRFLRYLRIAFSATCGLACVLLIVLWVRSYSYEDVLDGSSCGRFVQVVSSCGSLWVYFGESSNQDTPWGIATKVLDDRGRELEKAIRLQFTEPEFGSIKMSADGDGYLLIFPDWLLPVVACVIVAIAAAIPWINWRFSL